jgi:hypothetical protein
MTNETIGGVVREIDERLKAEEALIPLSLSSATNKRTGKAP